MTSDALSVVICTYDLDRWPLLVRSVRSVSSQAPAVREVVVVVDHNPELLVRASRSLEASMPTAPVRVIRNNCSAGLSGARNAGVAAASSEIVAFVDDDAVADVGWAGTLLSAYADDHVVAVGGPVLPVGSDGRPLWWPPEFDWIVGCSYTGLPTIRGPVRNLIGANMSVRRSVLLEVGGFADGIGRVGRRPVGCEETDLFIRISLRRPHVRIVFEPRAVAHHEVSSERLTWSYFRSRCLAEGESKAILVSRLGRVRALASERSYAARTLPRGIAGNLFRACCGEPGAGRRAMAIGAGLVLTTSGYVHGRFWLSRWGRGRRP